MANKNEICLLIVCLLISISCKTGKNNQSSDYKYKIITVDSISDVYILRAIHQGKYYKIVSQKGENNASNCNRIRIGKNYNLNLTSLFVDREKFRTNFDGIDFHGQTIELEKDSITDIYTANELKGLCFSKD